jgi:hypothetical protein
MVKYEVSNPTSGQVLGVYEGATDRDAIDACVKDAGYDSIEDMERSLGQPCELVAEVAE